MHFIALASLVLGALSASANNGSGETDPVKLISLRAPDDSIRANFISQGATLVNLFARDKNNKFRDIVVGFDNVTDYVSLAKGRQFFGPVVGRYANRIKNGTFSIPPSRNPKPGPNTFNITKNEHDGINTLHGGAIGYDLRAWNVSHQTDHSVTFSLIDPDGTEGFPGTVHAVVTYMLRAHGTWEIDMRATSDKKTPIMLSGHHFWNFEAYQESSDLNATFMQFPSNKVIDTDGILIPNGKFIDTKGTALDFDKATSIGKAIPETAKHQYCGTDCVGFDNCWIYDIGRKDKGKPVFSIWSKNSGIRLDVRTNQPALQIYTCNGIFNATAPLPRKKAHGGPNKAYENHSCLVIEQESYIDAINQPEWGIDQIYGAGRDYRWSSSYTFSKL